MMRSIKEIREHSGLSQSQFAKAYGFSTQAVQSWEQGTRKPQTSTLYMLNHINTLISAVELVPLQIAQNELVNRFGAHDIVPDYPYPGNNSAVTANFYIKSRNMYIEVFSAWMHGDGWFDPSNDDEQIKEWETLGKTNALYAYAAELWRYTDTEKRYIAKDNEMNLVVFWSDDLSSLYEWLNSGCPDGDADGSWRHNIKPIEKHISKCQEDTAFDGFDFSEKNKPSEQLLADILEQDGYFSKPYDYPKIIGMLKQKFGAADIMEDYTCPEYPFKHTYIRSKDMHIEIFNTPEHGGHWFSGDRELDTKAFDKLMNAGQCEMATNWACIDPIKRWYAGYYKLNYIVIWRPNLSDFKKWFDAGFPDGYDWYDINTWKE